MLSLQNRHCIFYLCPNPLEKGTIFYFSDILEAAEDLLERQDAVLSLHVILWAKRGTDREVVG